MARLRFCTSWSRQLATGNGATRARASSRCYQLLPSWYHPCMILLLLSHACCVGWCVVGEKAYFVVDCCVAEGIVVEHCCCTCSAFFGLFWSQDHKARESTTGSSHEDRAARIRWLSSARRAVWQGGGINMHCCCVVYQFIDIRCARFHVHFWGSI